MTLSRGLDKFQSPSRKLASPINLPNFYGLVNDQVETPCLISQLRPKPSPPLSGDYGSPSDDKLESGGVFTESPSDFGPAAPELSSSPSESFLSLLDLSPKSASFVKNTPANCYGGTYSHHVALPEPSLRRVNTVASSVLPQKPARRPHCSRPITSHSYSSHPSSDAVSFLSSFADSTASDLTRVSPDEEGEEVGKYIMGKIIGHGAFSTVREAYVINEDDDNSVTRLAVKVIRKDSTQESTEKHILEVENEVMLWKQLHHSHILKFVEIIDTDFAEFVFMELCPNGTLLDLIEKSGKMGEDDARKAFLQLAEALRYLHQDTHIVHSDLKLENIVIAEDGSLRLSDFGLSQLQNSGKPRPFPAGSISYCSPELLTNSTPNTYASDIWALGVILYTLVAGQFPFSDGFEPRLVLKIRTGKFEMPEGISESLIELLNGMLAPKPEDRLTITEILNSQWCQNHQA